MEDLLNLLDDAFGGINFTEEIQKYEEKYDEEVTNSAREVKIEDVIELVRNVSFS